MVSFIDAHVAPSVAVAALTSLRLGWEQFLMTAISRAQVRQKHSPAQAERRGGLPRWVINLGL